ncbi:hypothetical protein ABIA30_003124 [Mycobacterium sp. MAA66]|uniref:hypothetical protein n=1 Tax=Mycobacterium sp. MAA66 TaxID=3156297 RepID=UPI003515DF29
MNTETFWTARTVLTHIHTFARARRRCPWAVLGVALVYANGVIPPAVALPPHVGGRGSLNLFVALTGPSGAGKGTSEAAARDAIQFQLHTGEPVDLPEFPIGSGEGIARTFMPPTPTKKKAGEEDPPHREEIWTAVFSVPEIDTAAGLFARSGSTLESELRKVFSGEQLGFTNAQAHTRTRVPAHSYRAGLIFGVQPGRAGVLLDGAAGGTPQRMVWLPVLDADMPDERPDEPAPVVVRAPKFSGDLPVPQIARDAIDAHQLAMHRGEVEALDGHKLLVRLKVAAALMVLDGRDLPAISDDDWQLAGVVMEVSDETRAWVQRERSSASRAANRARALAIADRDDIVSDRKLQRVRKAIVRWLEKAGEQSAADLRQKLKADLRGDFGAAVAELADDGVICKIEVKNGVRYRLFDKSTPVPEVHPSFPQLSDGVPESTGVLSLTVDTADKHRSSDSGDESPVESTPTDESDPEAVKPPRPTQCSVCYVDLPTAARVPFCDDHADGAPATTTPARTEADVRSAENAANRANPKSVTDFDGTPLPRHHPRVDGDTTWNSFLGGKRRAR